MDLIIISASPKVKESTSDYFASLISSAFGYDYTLKVLRLGKEKILHEEYHDIYETNILVLIFPVYFNGLPSSLMDFMAEVEEVLKKRGQKINPTKIFAVGNTSYYNGQTSEQAINIIKNWTIENKFLWGQGIGIGGGRIFLKESGKAIGKGMNKNLGVALQNLTQNIKNENLNQENIYINPKMPEFLYYLKENKNITNLGKGNEVYNNYLSRS